MREIQKKNLEKRICIRIAEDDYRKLQRIAKKFNVKISFVAREFLKQKLDEFEL